MLLVHDDRAEVGERREERRARADGDAALAPLQRAPRVVTLAVGERGVQHRHPVAEHRAEAVHRLRRERDLGHEHDGRSPLPLDDVAQQLEVDERLPAPRDAAEQERLARRGAGERVDRHPLRRRGHRERHALPVTPGEGIALHHLVAHRHQP
ncbi:MAG TPA: hypothetical protein VFY16_07430, partial [Gemmatimonadaceae bacterium]|nr:hypothetical protein [Gemmatimonadaceae bacterium]